MYKVDSPHIPPPKVSITFLLIWLVFLGRCEGFLQAWDTKEMHNSGF